MQTRLVKIIPDSVGFGQRIWNFAKRNPGKTTAAVVTAPFVIPLEGVLLFGGALAGGVSGLTVGFLADALKKPEQFEIVKASSALHLQDLEGSPVSTNGIYARHPDASRANLIIPAGTFHSSMITEQMADLVSYIRSVVPARRIKIAVRSESGASLKADTIIGSEKFGVQGHAGSNRHHSLDLVYDDPRLIPVDGPGFWMRSFPEIGAAFHGAEKGSVKRILSIDTTFGLNASLAKSAGIDANWLGKQIFEVEADFG